jgi:hypothetical protein
VAVHLRSTASIPQQLQSPLRACAASLTAAACTHPCLPSAYATAHQARNPGWNHVTASKLYVYVYRLSQQCSCGRNARCHVLMADVKTMWWGE